jgi:hypothetical protein
MPVGSEVGPGLGEGGGGEGDQQGEYRAARILWGRPPGLRRAPRPAW